MKLNNLNKNTKAKVVSIDAPKELKLRLGSFGLVKGSVIYVDEVSLGKSTVKVTIDNNTIAIRAGEAENIGIEIIS
jgi:ferrous iron transport protein A